MNKLRIILLIFLGGIPFFLFLGKLSFLYNDEFLGNWILTPTEYPLSYSIFFGVIFSCSTILNFLLGNIRNYTKLIYVLLGIFLGTIINLCFVVFGFTKLIYPVYFIFIRIALTIIVIQLWDLTGITRLPEWEENISIIISVICLTIALLLLFNFLAKRLNDIKEKILWAILIFSIPFFPTIIAPLVGSYIGDRLSSVESKKLSFVKRALLAIPLSTLIIFSFIGMMKYYHLPGLIISPSIRAIFGTNYSYFFNSEAQYKAAIKDISNCQLIKNEIGEIKKITLFEGNNYTVDNLMEGSLGNYLHIQIIGENKQAFVKGCFKRGMPGQCFFANYDVKLADQNKAKIFSETGVKTIDISECL